ncbi:MAG: SAM-dependent methyltransferase, partial [Desulfobacterales bacterium]
MRKWFPWSHALSALGLTLMLIALAAQTPSRPATAAVPGSYTLVGIGPGDTDLLTGRALSAIQKADLIFCNPKTREKLAPLVDFKDKRVRDGYGVLFRFYGRDCAQVPEAERVWRGRSCEEFHQKQNEFVALVREAVKAGRHVVMLSGGDPTIFGPDMWTIKALADLNPTVVPGLSSFNAANAAQKVSLEEVIITAPFQHEGRTDTIEHLAVHERATMVVFMPGELPALFKRLSAVYPPGTPVAIVSHAGQAERQKVIPGTMADIGGKLDGVEADMSLVYVGKALAQIPTALAKAAASGAGKYYLVGMGPGDADLVTLQALEVIRKADLLFASQRYQKRYASLLTGKKVLDGYGRLFP